MKKLNAILAILRSESYYVVIPIQATKVKIWNEKFPADCAANLAMYISDQVQDVIIQNAAVKEAKEIINSL